MSANRTKTAARPAQRSTSSGTKSARANATASSYATTSALPDVGQHFTTLVQSGRDVTQRQLEAGLELTAGNVERVTTHMIKNVEDWTGANKEFFDAYTSYCTTWTKGCEEISRTYMTTYQNLAQSWMQCCKSMLTAKTMKEAMDTQGDYMRTQFDTVLAEGTKISELCVKLATEASEPVQTQWNQMVTKYGKAA